MDTMSKNPSKDDASYRTLETSGGVPVKAWVRGVELEQPAELQLRKAALMPFVHRWIAAMPDVHLGIGATVGSVIPTKAAIIPAAVGVDIGCGMMAVRTSVQAKHMPDSLAKLRSEIEAAVPHGRTVNGGKGDRGAWGNVPAHVQSAYTALGPRWDAISKKHRPIARGPVREQLGTLGSGNHFVEVCLDERDQVWVMLHSGSRGIGNAIGMHFIELAKREAERLQQQLPDRDLAWFAEGTPAFDDYVEAVGWAQDYARVNRAEMLDIVLATLRRHLPGFETTLAAVNCHHNYVARERHYGESVWVTRKGAIRAREGDLGIIPGSMGVQSYIVRGRGSAESFDSCAHGAGRQMSRNAARKRFSVGDIEAQTAGVVCRKDKGVLDEIPGAYKDIDEVMANQTDLVEVVHTLKQVLCVKG